MERPINLGGTLSPTTSKRLLISILRIFFILLYHQFAWTYDWIASFVSLGAWQSWVQSALLYLEGSKTLEIGFGPGHLQVSLTQRGISVIGVDESKQMVQITHRRLLRSGLRSNLARGNAQFLPFADESFNQVVMTFPAEFLLERTTYAEIYRVLIQGGLLLILPGAWITGRKPWERAIAWFNRTAGEAPDWDEKYLNPLKSLGFIIDWEMVEFPFSRLLVIRLVKPYSQSVD